MSFPLLKYFNGGLPWWAIDLQSSCQCKGYGFHPWSGKIPHASGLNKLVYQNY